MVTDVSTLLSQVMYPTLINIHIMSLEARLTTSAVMPHTRMHTSMQHTCSAHTYTQSVHLLLCEACYNLLQRNAFV